MQFLLVLLVVFVGAKALLTVILKKRSNFFHQLSFFQSDPSNFAIRTFPDPVSMSSECNTFDEAHYCKMVGQWVSQRK